MARKMICVIAEHERRCHSGKVHFRNTDEAYQGSHLIMLAVILYLRLLFYDNGSSVFFYHHSRQIDFEVFMHDKSCPV